MTQNTDNIRIKQEENLKALLRTASTAEMATAYFSDYLSDKETL